MLWDPEASFDVAPERLEHRHKLTAYAGRRLDGVVRRTFLRGEIVYDHGIFPPSPAGRLVSA